MAGDEVTLQVRRADAADAPSIASVLRQSFAEYESLYTTEAFATTTPTSDEIELRRREGPIWIALLGETIVGTVAAVGRSDDLYIRGMAALPNARGHGIGNKLLEMVEAYARANGFTRLTLSTTPFLDRAIRLYQRAGFVRNEGGPHDLFGTPLFTMTRELEP